MGSISKPFINGNILKEFVKSKNLVLIHHILIPSLGIPVSYNENIRIGDFLFAVGFLMEASTPLVCFRRILEILGKKTFSKTPDLRETNVKI